MLILFIRTVVLFGLAVVVMRVLGKRQIAQLQPYELVLAILISDLAAAPMGDAGIPLLYGIIPMLALIFMHAALTLCCMKSERLRKIIDGQSYALINRGELHNKALDRLGFSVSDLLEELRAAGFSHIEEVESAIIETSGKLSIFPKPEHEPVTISDMNLQPKPGGVPLPLVLSGRLQKDNLTRMAVSEAWLTAKLTRAGVSGTKSIALCSLGADGTMTIYNSSDISVPHIITTDYQRGKQM